MPDTTLTPTSLTQIEVGASEDSWGDKLNANAATINAWFNAGPALKLDRGGTGGTTASAARTNLGAAASGGNSDITSLSGLTTPLSASQGGTGRNDAKAPALVTGRTISISGDLIYASPNFDGSGNVTATGTLATVNVSSGVPGAFGSETAIPVITVNAKGLVTAVSTASLPPRQYLGLIGDPQTPSGTSAASFLSIPNTHKTLVVSLAGVGSTSAAQFIVEYSTNNGSSWNLLKATGEASAGGSDAEIVIRNANGALGDFVCGTLVGQGPSWDDVSAYTATPGGAINAIRVRTSSGNFDGGGTIRLLSV